MNMTPTETHPHPGFLDDEPYLNEATASAEQTPLPFVEASTNDEVVFCEPSEDPAKDFCAENDLSEISIARKLVLRLASVVLALLVFVQLIVSVGQKFHQVHQIIPWLGWGYLFSAILILLIATGVVFRGFADYFSVSHNQDICIKGRQLLANPSPEATDYFFKLIERRYATHPLHSVRRGVMETKQQLQRSVVAEDILGRINASILRPIDERADALIRRETARTALASAISPFPAVDMLIVAWRGLIVVRDMAGLYGYRPGIVGSLRLLTSGGAATAFAGASQLAADAAPRLMQVSLLGRVSLALAQGLTTGFFMARLGIAAQIACRPLPIADEKVKNRFILLATSIRDLFRRRWPDAELPDKV